MKPKVATHKLTTQPDLLPRTRTANARVGFYAALNGYIDLFAPLPGYMVGNSYAERTPQSWLEVAEAFARRVRPMKPLLATLEEVKALVAQDRCQEARRIVQRGLDDANLTLRNDD